MTRETGGRGGRGVGVGRRGGGGEGRGVVAEYILLLKTKAVGVYMCMVQLGPDCASD